MSRGKRNVVPGGCRSDPRQHNARDAEGQGADDQRFDSEHQRGLRFPHLGQFRAPAAVDGWEFGRRVHYLPPIVRFLDEGIC